MNIGYTSKISDELTIILVSKGMKSKGPKFFSTAPKAPTYGEVFDWLADRFKIVITLTPWPTFALENRTAYSYCVSVYNEETSKFDRFADPDMASFGYEAEEAIKRALTFIP